MTGSARRARRAAALVHHPALARSPAAPVWRASLGLSQRFGGLLDAPSPRPAGCPPPAASRSRGACRHAWRRAVYRRVRAAGFPAHDVGRLHRHRSSGRPGRGRLRQQIVDRLLRCCRQRSIDGDIVGRPAELEGRAGCRPRVRRPRPQQRVPVRRRGPWWFSPRCSSRCARMNVHSAPRSSCRDAGSARSRPVRVDTPPIRRHSSLPRTPPRARCRAAAQARIRRSSETHALPPMRLRVRSSLLSLCCFFGFAVCAIPNCLLLSPVRATSSRPRAAPVAADRAPPRPGTRRAGCAPLRRSLPPPSPSPSRR